MDLTACCFCGGNSYSLIHRYTTPPSGETSFAWSGEYSREFVQCKGCQHFFSKIGMDISALYKKDYVDATYTKGLGFAFDRILSLSPERSDNVGRVRRVDAFAGEWLDQKHLERKLLDVGSGLCVFAHAMKQTGWDCSVIDPDPRAAEHARTRVGVEAFCGQFSEVETKERYPLVTFNKVLEHVQDPIRMLKEAHGYLEENGLVYVELPDGEGAMTEGPQREEFFVEHFHVFSENSIQLLAEKANFKVVGLERLKEPSTKYTLRAFLTASK